MKRENNYAPRLPEKKINQIVQELSNPNLIPQPYICLDHTGDLADKIKEAINELVAEYNRKVVKIVEAEKKVAFAEGVKAGIAKRKNIRGNKTHAKT